MERTGGPERRLESKGEVVLECGKIRKDFGSVECETGKQKRELRERERLKFTEVGLMEAARMRARLCEGKLSMFVQVGAGT